MGVLSKMIMSGAIDDEVRKEIDRLNAADKHKDAPMSTIIKPVRFVEFRCGSSGTISINIAQISSVSSNPPKDSDPLTFMQRNSRTWIFMNNGVEHEVNCTYRETLKALGIEPKEANVE